MRPNMQITNDSERACFPRARLFRLAVLTLVLIFVLAAPVSGQDGGQHWVGTPQPASAGYTVVSVTIDRSVTEPLQKIDTVVQAGTNPINRFTMHHLYHGQGVVKGSIILIPSAFSSFTEYMLDENHGRMQSLAEALAREHYDVYGYSPRTANLPVHACTSGAVDCSAMKDWNLGTYVQDVEYIRTQASRVYKPVVGGLSLGAGVGVAAVNANTTGYSGLLLWEGLMYSTNPVVLALATSDCSSFGTAIANGVYYEENLAPLLKQLAQMGEAATIQFYGVPQPNSVPNWIQLVADPTGTRYEFASFPRVFDFTMNFINVESLPIFRDFSCSNAGDRTYTSNLGNFKASVLAIGGGKSFGPYMQDVINLMSSAKVRFELDQAFGHLDAYLTSQYPKYSTDRILEWLRTDVFRQ